MQCDMYAMRAMRCDAMCSHAMPLLYPAIPCDALRTQMGNILMSMQEDKPRDQESMGGLPSSKVGRIQTEGT
jgi:hypothetical protein